MDVRFLIIVLLFLTMGVYFIYKMVKSGTDCKIPAEATIVKVDLVKRCSGGNRKSSYELAPRSLSDISMTLEYRSDPS